MNGQSVCPLIEVPGRGWSQEEVKECHITLHGIKSGKAEPTTTLHASTSTTHHHWEQGTRRNNTTHAHATTCLKDLYHPHDVLRKGYVSVLFPYRGRTNVVLGTLHSGVTRLLLNLLSTHALEVILEVVVYLISQERVLHSIEVVTLIKVLEGVVDADINDT